MVGTLIAALVGLFGVAVFAVAVSRLYKDKLEQIANKNRSQVGSFNKLVVENLHRGSVSTLDLGIFKDGKKTAILKITADTIDSDITEGQVITC
ncbi:MAG: hypothetical protein V4577_25905 [Bacteroidota bacterium]